ncbi:MAG: hypothetical protein ACREQM_21740 [Candidatus Dormibacteraceae bacterium]
MVAARLVLEEMFARREVGLFEPLQQTPAEFQANLHESLVDLIHTVDVCEAWQRTEDRIDAALPRLGGAW